MAILGIDIGGTQIKAGLVSSDGSVLEVRRIPSPATIAQFRREFPKLLAPLRMDSIDGAGIGCKGIIQSETAHVLNLPGTMNYLEGEILGRYLPAGTKIAADNDARVALAGEIAWGAAKGRRNAIMLTLGTGVGGGVLAEGRIVRGSNAVAGHLGHYTVRPDGPLCICGNRGCLETYFSARAIESAAAAMHHRGIATRIPPNAACQDVFDAAAQGDAPAMLIVSEAIAHLAAAIAGMLFMLDPEVVILGGQITSAGDQLFVPLRKQVWERTLPFLRKQTPIVLAELVDSSGVAGAAALLLAG
jgi:glucokinase